jgi:hypothetical protein
MNDTGAMKLVEAIIGQARTDYIDALIQLDAFEPIVQRAKWRVQEVERSIMGPSMSYLLGGQSLKRSCKDGRMRLTT